MLETLTKTSSLFFLLTNIELISREKTDTHVYVQLSTGDEFTIEADGHTRTIDALLRLCFSNVAPACSVQWSLSVASIRSDVLSANWLQLSTATLAGAKVFGEVRVNLKVYLQE